MSALHVTQIRAALTRLLEGKIDLSDLPKNTDMARREDSLATRSLAAYGTALAAGVPPETVAEYVVDSFGDNGIDVIFFEPDEKRLYLCQSKFAKNGDSGIPLGDALKFLAGVRDLLNSDFSRFKNNKRVLALKNLVSQALEDASTRVTLVLVHTSIEPLSDDIKSRLEELLQEVNDASDLIDFRAFDQTDIHNALSGQAEGAPLSIEAMISDWGHVRDPFPAYYGQINAAELATLYTKHGDRLLTKNIRKSLGATDVNRQIIATASESPDHFWYFNNGVTVLCQSVVKKPLGGGGKASAVLECRGISIVNGAQTVAALAEAAGRSQAEVKRASVLIRFISLEGCPEGFATAVTRATNVQNRIEHRDFASLDPTQERLRRELLLEGKTYAYKAGETIPTTDTACTMEEAAIALACSHQDVSLAVLVKGKIGRIWDNLDTQRSTYKRLFRESLTGVALWRLIELLRTIEDVLRHQQRAQISNKERMIAVHGNRFVAHEVFQRLDTASVTSSSCDVEKLKMEIPRLVAELLPLTAAAVQSEFPNAYLQSLFKNTSKCQKLGIVLKRRTHKKTEAAADQTLAPRGSGKKRGKPRSAEVPPSARSRATQHSRRRASHRESKPQYKSIVGPLISDLNAKEKLVVAHLRQRRAAIGLTEIGAGAFPQESPIRANSWARNSMRKLVRIGLVDKVGRGTYILR